MSSGAKALVCKADERFVLFVMPADRRLDSAAVRRTLGIRSLRFATPEEVAQRTGTGARRDPAVRSGCSGLPTYCDQAIADEATINFNAGDRAISVAMAASDYLAVERPTLGRFARE